MSRKRKSASEKYVVVAEQPRTVLVAVVSFLAGAVLTWAGMHFLAPAAAPVAAVQAGAGNGAPDVSKLPAGPAAVELGNWEYDHSNWAAAVEHYQRAVAAGMDSPDLRTDLGTAYRYLGNAPKALEQYALAQRKDPFHQNSLFNQAVVQAELLHDSPKAIATAREFLRRFPQSQGAAAARALIADLEGGQAKAEEKLGEFLRTPAAKGATP